MIFTDKEREEMAKTAGIAFENLVAEKVISEKILLYIVKGETSLKVMQEIKLDINEGMQDILTVVKANENYYNVKWKRSLMKGKEDEAKDLPVKIEGGIHWKNEE